MHVIFGFRSGRTILHPSLPGPTDTKSNRSFLPLSLFESGLPPDVILNITSGGSGHQRFNVSNLISTGLTFLNGKVTLLRGTDPIPNNTAMV